MADLSRFTLPTGNTYYFKDEVARATVAGGIHFKGVTTTPLFDEATTTTMVINQEPVTVANGDLVIFNKKEFIYSTVDNQWHELGDNSSFGSLAYSNTASADYLPEGTIDAPSFNGIQGTVEVNGTTQGSVSVNIQTGENVDGNYTPTGTITKPNVNVNLDTTKKYVASSTTGGGTVVPGEAAECTLPQLTMTVVDETLVIGWSEGSFKANTPTHVELPQFAEQTIATGVQSAGLSAAPVFNGDDVLIGAAFNGESITSTGTFTPEGTNTAPLFHGTEASIVVEA